MLNLLCSKNLQVYFDNDGYKTALVYGSCAALKSSTSLTERDSLNGLIDLHSSSNMREADLPATLPHPNLSESVTEDQTNGPKISKRLES